MSAPLPPSALARLEAAAPLFTAGVGVDELAALRETGYTPAGLVMGTAMQHIGFAPQRWSQSVELGMLTQALLSARSLAVSRMEAEATALGADGVVDVRLETVAHEGAGDVVEFLATGTAVRAAKGGAPMFTTQLSGQELKTLAGAGYAPALFVFGLCVYHVAHQTMRQALAPNVELPQYTQAFYDGRELAVARMQARAAEAGASGVIGVEMQASAQIWRQHAIEFLATGERGAEHLMRARLAPRAGRAVAGLSRRLGRGDGTVIGGRVSMLVDPNALAHLGAGRWISLVSGTNGKTTTTRLLTAALGTAGPVTTNPQGSNLPPGLVAGLSRAAPGAAAALEVDEAWLGKVASSLHPATMTLLNLTRDQLDRVAEVRRLAERWRDVVTDNPTAHVIANADDPLVAWAGAASAACTWVGAGQPWRDDAAGCPSCWGRIVWEGAHWACTTCDFARPAPSVWLEGDALVTDAGGRHPIALRLPGRANRANAAMAAATAARAGVALDVALEAMAATSAVDGRYRTVAIGGATARLLLAKNPAGWLEAFEMLAPPPGPVVIVVNARIADGRDPSWLWDVPFERLAGRPVIASGDRSRDVAVRLHYAGVDHRRIDDPIEGVRAVGPGPVDVAANYTALRDIDRRLS